MSKSQAVKSPPRSLYIERERVKEKRERETGRVCSLAQTEHYEQQQQQRRQTVLNVFETILGKTVARIERLLDKDAAPSLSSPRPL